MIVLVVLAAALALALFMAVAWLVQRRTGQAGWVDTIWSLAVGTVGAGLALAPIEGRHGR
jgi:steroid 5-alpha reductase family enzyme